MRRRSYAWIALLVALGCGGWLLFGPRRERQAADAVDAPRTVAVEPTEVAAPTPVELAALPAFESLDTTVVFPLEVVLELARLDGSGELDARTGATARLSGMVVDAAGAGTRCELRFVGGLNQGRVLFSDGLGRFGANDLYPGLALVQVVAPGSPGCLREVRLRNERDALLNVSFARMAKVSGRIVGPDGQGVAEARVQLDGQSATTDEQGGFALPQVAAGEALLFVDKPGLASARSIVSVPVGGVVEPEQLTIVLERGARLTIAVDEPINSGVEALVHLMAEASGAQRRYPWHRISPVRVWPGGQATVEDLPSGPLALRLFHAGARAEPERVQVSLSPGEEEAVVLHMVPAPVVSGVVTLRGAPARDAVVRLETPDRVGSLLRSYGQSSWMQLETEVYSNLPSAVQEIRTNGRGEYSITSYEDLSARRLLTAVSADGRSRAARLLKGGETSVDLQLEAVRAGSSVLTLRLPTRWQALPVRIAVNGEPRDPFLLPPGQDLDIEGLPGGEWLVTATWNGEALVEKRGVVLRDEAAIACELPEGAIVGQDEDTRRRAGAR